MNETNCNCKVKAWSLKLDVVGGNIFSPFRKKKENRREIQKQTEKRNAQKIVYVLEIQEC